MYELDVLAVGGEGRSGDAIAMRFSTPSGGFAHVAIDAGFEASGKALAEHVATYYGVDTLDLLILTHPDGDHIGGMGEVVRGLNVKALWLHDLGARGGASLDAADAVDELISVARAGGTEVLEPFAGASAFGGALTVLGPSEAYYDELVDEQLRVEAAYSAPGRTMTAARTLGQRFLSSLPVEIPFGDGEGTSSRNNSSIVTMLEVDGKRLLFTADAGVPALDRAWDYVEASGMGTDAPSFAQIPHHGSRRNASSALLDRIHGSTDKAEHKTAIISVSKNADDKHPAPRVVNAYKRRGFKVIQTAGMGICHYHNAPSRSGWYPVSGLEAMDESAEGDE